jgi:hypothetical protein
MILPLDTIEYLSSLHGKVPNTRIGIAFDGQRLAAVFYSVVKDLDAPMIERNGIQRRPEKVLVWFADSFEPIGMSLVYPLLDQILDLSTGLTSKELTIFAKGVQKGVWSFTRESKLHHGVRIKEFEKRSYGSWTPEELAMTIRDDLTELRIEPAPEFRRRPEYELLNSELRNLKLVDALSGLQEAALYGLGMWSALDSRAKYGCGSSRFAVY